MAHSFVSNKKNTSFVLHVYSSNSSLNIVGNSSVSSVAISNEVLTGAYITQAAWGCDGTGYVVVKRGANSVLVLDSTGQHDYAGSGMPINTFPNANISFEFVGSSNCFVVIEMQKIIGSTSSEYFQT